MTATTAPRYRDGDTVTRETQEPDTLYVNPDGTCWYTPDGIGRICVFADPDEQTVLMDEEDAIEEMGPEWVVYLDAEPRD